jgi:hypothetical protein
MTLPHFCIFVIIFPFEEDLAFYLNKLTFPSPKDVKHQMRISTNQVSLHDTQVEIVEKAEKYCENWSLI